MEKVSSSSGISLRARCGLYTADCPICLLGFEDGGWRRPKLLSCHHAFCSSCLGSLLDGDARGTQLWRDTAVLGLCCPLCRRFTAVPGGIVALLPDCYPETSLDAQRHGDDVEEEVGRQDEESRRTAVCETSACVKHRDEEQGVAEGIERGAVSRDQPLDTPRSVQATRRMLALLSVLLLILLALLPLHHSPTILALAAITAMLMTVNMAALCCRHQDGQRPDAQAAGEDHFV